MFVSYITNVKQRNIQGILDGIFTEVTRNSNFTKVKS